MGLVKQGWRPWLGWIDWTNEKLFIKKAILAEEQVRSGTASQESILSVPNLRGETKVNMRMWSDTDEERWNVDNSCASRVYVS